MTAQEILSMEAYPVGPVQFQDVVVSASGEGVGSIRLRFDGRTPDVGPHGQPTVLAEPSEAMRVGETYSTILRFERTTFRGWPAVAAERFTEPFPDAYHRMAQLAESAVAGQALRLQGAEGPWALFKVDSPSSHPWSEVEAWMVRWPKPAMHDDFDGVIDSASDWYLQSAVAFASLQNMDTTNCEPPEGKGIAVAVGSSGDIQPGDAGQEAFLESGDPVRIRLPADAGYELYSLGLKGPDGGPCIAHAMLLLNGPHGPMAWQESLQ